MGPSSSVLEASSSMAPATRAGAREENVYSALTERRRRARVQFLFGAASLEIEGMGGTAPDYRLQRADYRSPVQQRVRATETEYLVPSPEEKMLGGRSLSTPVRTVLQALDEDLAWVKQNVDRLTERHGRVYVAVRDGQVFGADADESSLVMRLFRRHGREGFLIVSLEDPRLRGEEELPEMEPGVIDEDVME